MTFMVEKSNNNKKDIWRVEETVKIGFDLLKNIWIKIKKLERRNLVR